MFRPRRRLYALVVLLLVAGLVLEPLSARSHESGPRASLDLSSPFRAVASVFGAGAAAVGGFFGGIFGSSAATAAAAPSPSASPSSAPSPDAPGEIVSKRSEDGKFFRDKDGSTRAEFALHQHYQSAPGRWEKVKLDFHADGSDQVADRNDVIVRVSNRALLTMQRGSGKGIRWNLPARPTVSDRRARFAGQGGFAWTYFNTDSGVKLLSDPVSAAVGAKTYSFAYQLLGSASPLTVDGQGNLVSDVFMLPRAYIFGADEQAYPASAWRIEDGVVSFDFDDSTLPESAFPYRVDPTTTYSIPETFDTHDDLVLRYGSTYTPTDGRTLDWQMGQAS